MVKGFLILILFFLNSSSLYADTPNPNGMDSNATIEKPVTHFDDSEIIGLLIALNNNQINAAKIALKQADNPDVVEFAKMMIEDHSRNLNDTLKISEDMDIPAKNTTKVWNLKKQGKEEDKKLNLLTTSRFEKYYRADSFKAHSDALTLIQAAITDVDNDELKKHLVLTEEAIKKHLLLLQLPNLK